MWYNPIMRTLLRSPLHGMLSKNMMLITVTGRKSGRQYTVPVNYYQQGDDLWIVSQRERTWWRNLEGGVPVSLVLKGRAVQAFGEAVTDQAEVVKRLAEYVEHFPMAARALRVEIEDGSLNPQSLEQASKPRVFVRIQLR